jgi:hypothetical protein
MSVRSLAFLTLFFSEVRTAHLGFSARAKVFSLARRLSFTFDPDNFQVSCGSD